jgi:hypothetical protein
MDTSFCLDALEDALGKERPEVFNTHQGRNSPARHSPICWKCRGADQHERPRTLVGQRLRRAPVGQLKYVEVHLKAYADGLAPPSSASASGSVFITSVRRNRPRAIKRGRWRGRPRWTLWICRCARTTLARRLKLRGANNCKGNIWGPPLSATPFYTARGKDGPATVKS